MIISEEKIQAESDRSVARCDGPGPAPLVSLSDGLAR